MIHKTLFPQVVLALLVSTAISSPAQDTKKPSAAKEGVSISEQEGKLRIEINGELFSEYYYQDVSRPFLCPAHRPRRRADDPQLADEERGK